MQNTDSHATVEKVLNTAVAVDVFVTFGSALEQCAVHMLDRISSGQPVQVRGKIAAANGSVELQAFRAGIRVRWVRFAGTWQKILGIFGVPRISDKDRSGSYPGLIEVLNIDDLIFFFHGFPNFPPCSPSLRRAGTSTFHRNNHRQASHSLSRWHSGCERPCARCNGRQQTMEWPAHPGPSSGGRYGSRRGKVPTRLFPVA